MLPADTRPEPIYQLHWRDRERYRSGGDPVNALLEVTLERVMPQPDERNETDQAPQSEALRITAVDGSWNGRPVLLEDVELALCTLETETHWLDAGTFQINLNP
jgi:hypothetical protein